MTPATIIQQAASDGVSLALSATGTIKVLGDETAVGRWVPTIRESKVAIIAALKVGAGDTALTTPQIEALTGAIPLARETPQPEAENSPDADPGCLVSLNVGAGDTAWTPADDRRLCTNCLHLLDGVCRIAKPGGLVSARRGYRPVAMPMRCAGFAPMGDDADQRPGAERWPGLAQP